MTIEEMLEQRPADEQNVAAHKERMQREVAEEAKKNLWRHSDWD